MRQPHGLPRKFPPLPPPHRGEANMRTGRNYWFMAQAALIGVMPAAVDFGLYEALNHTMR